MGIKIFFENRSTDKIQVIFVFTDQMQTINRKKSFRFEAGELLNES